jgi:hypothetical protein
MRDTELRNNSGVRVVSNPYTGIVLQADAITAAPIPAAAKKSALRRLYETALAQDAKAALSHPTTQSLVSTALAGGEGAGIGYMLGLLAGGSQAKYAGAATAAVAAIGLGGSLVPGNPVPEHFRNVGVAGAAILAYRQAEAKKRAQTAGVHGIANEENGPDDPLDHIVQIAKKLGIT